MTVYEIVEHNRAGAAAANAALAELPPHVTGNRREAAISTARSWTASLALVENWVSRFA